MIPDPTTDAPSVRPAVPADAPAIAAILSEALGAKYRPALGSRAVAGLAGMVRDDIAGGSGGFLVAELDGEPVGAVHLATAESRPPEAFARRLAERVGPLRALRAMVVLSLLRPDPLTADEGHIGELAVTSAARRRGVARALLDAVERRAAEAGKSRLTLWVTGENAGAIALYESTGFRPVRRRRWPLGRLVFRASGILLMEKRTGRS
ncbi:MAG: GNAT family N-acetyltransferase [Thermoleophilia bacterium]